MNSSDRAGRTYVRYNVTELRYTRHSCDLVRVSVASGDVRRESGGRGRGGSAPRRLVRLGRHTVLGPKRTGALLC